MTRHFVLYKKYSDGEWRKISEVDTHTWLDAELYFDKYVDGRAKRASPLGFAFLIVDTPMEKVENRSFSETIIHMYRGFPLQSSDSVFFYESEIKKILELIKEAGGDSV